MKLFRMSWFLLTLPADVVPGAEEDGLEPEHQLAEKPRLRVLEDLNPLQGVEVNVDGYLPLQLVWKGAFNILLIVFVTPFMDDNYNFSCKILNINFCILF